MTTPQDLQTQAVQLGQQTIAAASQTLQQAVAQATPAAQKAAHDVGQSAGQGYRQGVLGDFTNGEVAVMAVGAVAALGLLGWAGWRAHAPRAEGMMALGRSGETIEIENVPRDERGYAKGRYFDDYGTGNLLFMYKRSGRGAGWDDTSDYFWASSRQEAKRLMKEQFPQARVVLV